MFLYFMCIALFITILLIINSFNNLTIHEGFKRPKDKYLNTFVLFDIIVDLTRGDE
jgi:hypothetical protein